MNTPEKEKGASHTATNRPASGGKDTARKNPKGDPCEFIFPPNNLLAKVTHNPAMAKIQTVKKGEYIFDKTRLGKMTSIIEKNQAVCIDTLNQKIKELEPIYEDLRNGKIPIRAPLFDKIQHVNAVSIALDHIPVSRITNSLLNYLKHLPVSTELASSILITHFDALFNRETLNVKLDPPTKMVLTALEALTDHALLTSS